MNQRVVLHLYDAPIYADTLKGMAAELSDCAMPLLDQIIHTSDPKIAFKDANYNFVVGTKPRLSHHTHA